MPLVNSVADAKNLTLLHAICVSPSGVLFLGLFCSRDDDDADVKPVLAGIGVLVQRLGGHVTVVDLVNGEQCPSVDPRHPPRAANENLFAANHQLVVE